MQVIFFHSPVGEYFPTQQASNSAVDFTLDADWCPLIYLGSLTLPGDRQHQIPPGQMLSPTGLPPAPFTCQLQVSIPCASDSLCKPKFPQHHPWVQLICQSSSQKSRINLCLPICYKVCYRTQVSNETVNMQRGNRASIPLRVHPSDAAEGHFHSFDSLTCNLSQAFL